MTEPATVRREVFGTGEDLLLCGNIWEPPAEWEALAGRVQCVYADPPFMTGDRYYCRRPFGKKGWKTGSPAPQYETYVDRFDGEEDYLRLLRRIIENGRELLRETGVFFLHLDWHMSARGRLSCDEIFGPDRFLNEIIWAYESGGRAKRWFPRKHDTILMYARSEKYRFDLTRVPIGRKEQRKNHMARGVDEDGRTYSWIRSGGKEYRYYDDEPMYPGDVWTDISHLQQRDPERTGFATQKPRKLLERLLLPVVKEGDWVADPCCGSGTTLVAAQGLGCRFAGMDPNPAALTLSMGRLRLEDLTVVCPTEGSESARLLAEWDAGKRLLRVNGLETSHEAFPEKADPMDALEAWEAGYIREGVFYSEKAFRRSHAYPDLARETQMPGDEIPAVLTTDAAGRRNLFSL